MRNVHWMMTFAILTGCAEYGPFRSDESGVDGGTGGGGDADDSAPRMLFAVTDKPSRLVVGGTYVYWTGLAANQISRMPIAGGTSQSVTASAKPTEIVADGSDVYWLTTAGSLQGTSASTFASPTTYATVPLAMYVAISPSFVFFTNWGANENTPETGSLMRLPRTGGNATAARANQLAATGVTADASMVYWSTFEEVHRGAHNPTSPTTIATNQGTVEHIAVAGSRACWTSLPDVNTDVYDVMCSTGGAPQKIASGQVKVLDLEVTDGYAYWAAIDQGTNGSLHRYRFADGRADVPVTPGAIVTDLAVDATHLYWIERTSASTNDGEIWRARQ